MRERDVREALNEWVNRLYAHEHDTLTVSEMVICRGLARIDLAVINGKLHGYEIKSDADTLIRLPKQSHAYNGVFDAITIVAGARHVKEASHVVPDWWGILQAESAGGFVELTAVRNSTTNPDRSGRAIAYLLWKDEAVRLLRAHGITRGLSGKSRDWLCAEISAKLHVDAIASYTRETLKSRKAWRAAGQQR